MAKTLCDWSKKDIQNHPEKLAEILCDPGYFCAKCARSANTPKRLCKARKIPLVFARVADKSGW